MAWSSPRGDLRLLLNDDDRGNLIKDKRVFPFRSGKSDGTTTTFYTFEDRLVASGNQSVCARPLQLYYDNVQVSASGINVTDVYRGQFTVMGVAPSGVDIRASYYYQEYVDGDLDFALQQGANLVSTATVDQVAPGLQMACLSFAGSIAHQRAAMRWRQRKSDQFLLEDIGAQAELDARVAFHVEQSRILDERAQKYREQFYNLRLDRGRQPAYGLLKRTPGPWTPRR